MSTGTQPVSRGARVGTWVLSAGARGIRHLLCGVKTRIWARRLPWGRYTHRPGAGAHPLGNNAGSTDRAEAERRGPPTPPSLRPLAAEDFLASVSGTGPVPSQPALSGSPRTLVHSSERSWRGAYEGLTGPGLSRCT